MPSIGDASYNSGVSSSHSDSYDSSFDGGVLSSVGPSAYGAGPSNSYVGGNVVPSRGSLNAFYSHGTLFRGRSGGSFDSRSTGYNGVPASAYWTGLRHSNRYGS